MFERLAAVLFTIMISIAFLPSQTSAQVSSDEAKCRAFISKSVGKQVKAAQKAIGKCHKDRIKGKILPAVDCNTISIADTKGKVAGAEMKFSDNIVAQCSDTGGPLGDVLAQFTTCHSPSETADDGGATTDIDDFLEVAACVSAMARALSESNARQILGTPDALAVQNLENLTKNLSKCHAEVGKRYAKLIETAAKVGAKCQKASDASSGPLDYVCAGLDPDGKILKTLNKLKASVTKRCGSLSLPDMNTLDMCGDSADQVGACAGDKIASLVGDGLVAMSYNLDSCPRGFDLTMRAANCSSITNTESDLGTNGIGHDRGGIDATLASLELSCNPSCSVCAATLEAGSNCRCANDPTIICNEVNALDPANCGADLCECYLGPPQPISANGTGACVLQRTTSVSGTIGAGSGQVDLNAQLLADVYLPIDALQPCPICVGDPIFNDGIAGGLCDGGPRNGLSCDTNGDTCDLGATSHDCPPDPGFLVTGSGVAIELDPLTDGPIAKTKTLTGLFGSAVACGTCTLDPTIGCFSDVTCILAGAGTCDGSGHFPNACSLPFNSSCVPGGVGPGGGPDDGVCSPVDTDTYCDGVLLSNGEPVLTCATDADCIAQNPICPGSFCGLCTINKSRECFLDPIAAIGSATGPYQADLASIYCHPGTFSAAINATHGYPGPGRLVGDFALTPRCGECALLPSDDCSVDADCGVNGPCVSNATTWNAPIGSLCP